MRKYIITLLILLLLPMSAKAGMCDYDDKVKFQSMAENISANYEYVEEDGNITFTIKFSNVPDGFKIYDFYNDIAYENLGHEFSAPAMVNSSYTFNIYTDDLECQYDPVGKKYVSIPPYNPYYNDEVCKGFESYKLCNKWINMTMTYDSFKEAVLKAKEQKAEKEEIQEPEEVKGIFDYIIEFCKKYYYIIIPVAIICIAVGTYLYNKKHDLF